MPIVEDVRARQMPPTLVFIRVPEGKTVKNRLHLDVSPVDGSTEDEVSRLLALGATRTDVDAQATHPVADGHVAGGPESGFDG